MIDIEKWWLVPLSGNTFSPTLCKPIALQIMTSSLVKSDWNQEYFTYLNRIPWTDIYIFFTSVRNN